MISVNPSFMPVLSSPFLLLGHEHPFSILLLHISQQLQRGGESSVQNAPVQFVVRKKVAPGENMPGECVDSLASVGIQIALDNHICSCLQSKQCTYKGC